jgi:uncharacterized MnhB-related membrane protein
MTPRRQRVMSPQTRQALAHGGRRTRENSRPTVTSAGAAHTSWASAPSAVAGSPAVAVALRAQRRLAARTMVVLLAAIVVAPLLLAMLPAPGVAVSWAMLGVAVYPALWWLAVRHRRATDRLESEIERRASQVGG